VAPFAANIPENWILGISPEGAGIIGMALNFTVATIVARNTAPPPHISSNWWTLSGYRGNHDSGFDMRHLQRVYISRRKPMSDGIAYTGSCPARPAPGCA